MSKQGGVFLDTATGKDFLDESTHQHGLNLSGIFWLLLE